MEVPSKRYKVGEWRLVLTTIITDWNWFLLFKVHFLKKFLFITRAFLLETNIFLFFFKTLVGCWNFVHEWKIKKKILWPVDLSNLTEEIFMVCEIIHSKFLLFLLWRWFWPIKWLQRSFQGKETLILFLQLETPGLMFRPIKWSCLLIAMVTDQPFFIKLQIRKKRVSLSKSM